MKVEIVEVSDTRDFMNMPISYRVEIKVYRDTITIKRQYFRVGFSDGEQYDDFYFDNDWCGRQSSPVSRCTFITKKIEDKKYLQQKENELIEKFYRKCIKSKELIKKELREVTKKLNDDLITYDNILNHFEYLNRGDKLKKLKNKLNDK